MIGRVALVVLAASGCRQLLGFEELAAPTSEDGKIADALSPDGQEPDDGPADGVGDASAGCPDSYAITIGASRYRHVTTSAITWLAAATDCADDGATTHLVVLGDDLERGSVGAFTNPLVTWIGLSDRKTNGVLLAVTDEDTAGYPPLLGPWLANEPSNGTTEDCISMVATADLQDEGCGNGRAYVCECDGFANNPMNY